MINFLFFHTPLFYLIQSLWRDEAFSYFMARPNFWTIIKSTASDFNPPLYYLLLHVWILIVGKSDVLLRVLSFSFHLGTVYFGFVLAKKIFSKKYALFVALFLFFNPMLLYYAFEIRMYSLYALCTIASFYFLYTKQWKKYTAWSIFGLYTHSFFPLILISYGLSYLYGLKGKRKDLIKIFLPIVFYLPWIPVILNQFSRSSDSWIFPVDLQLVQSLLGNLFTSYEGTPGQLWKYTALLSGFLLLSFVYFIKKKTRQGALFLTPIFFPLAVIIGYSFLKRPIYVNRYLIFVSIFEVLGFCYALWLVKKTALRNIFVLLSLVIVLAINIYLSPYKQKTDFKTTFIEINNIASTSDFVYSKTPIAFLESAYYYKDENRVFVYNPDHIAIPNYIGSNLVFPLSSKSDFPMPPSKTFLILDDANFEVVIQR